MNESILEFEERFWGKYVIGVALSGDTALEVLKTFYSTNKQFQEKVEGYLDRIYEKVLETNFECLSSRESYLELPSKVFFTVLDWYIDTLRKLESEGKYDGFPIYDANELSGGYVKCYNLRDSPKSLRVLNETMNTSTLGKSPSHSFCRT